MKGIMGLFLCILILCGCTYNVKPTSMPALNIYSSYDEKIPGTWIIVIDSSCKNVVREIKTSSYVCSAHKYPINIGDTIAISIKRTMDVIFENVIERSNMPSYKELQQTDTRGVILVRMDTFEPRVSCSTGFWSASCVASTDVGFGVIVKGRQGRLFATSVGDSATAYGDAGGACESAANVLSESISKSVRKALERLGERLANSSRLRKEANSQD